MNITDRFKNFLIPLIEKNKVSKLLNILDKLYLKKILNEELIFNIIKGLTLIFYIDPNYFDIYYKIFIDLLTYENTNKISKQLCSLDMSIQMKLNNRIIEKIILYTNLYFFNLKDIQTDITLLLLLNFIHKVKDLKLSINYKINLYFHFINKAIKNKDKETILIDLDKYLTDVIKIIISFIKK